jgi:hypothetical protein
MTSQASIQCTSLLHTFLKMMVGCNRIGDEMGSQIFATIISNWSCADPDRSVKKGLRLQRCRTRTTLTATPHIAPARISLSTTGDPDRRVQGQSALRQQWPCYTRSTWARCSGSSPWAPPLPSASRTNCPPANLRAVCSSATATCAICSLPSTTTRIVSHPSGTCSDTTALARVYDFTVCDIEPANIGSTPTQKQGLTGIF